MIHERFYKLRNGEMRRACEVQTELAEWEQVSDRCWVRRVRERRAK